MKKKEIVTLALTTALLMTAHAVPASAASNAPESMSQTGSIQTITPRWESTNVVVPSISISGKQISVSVYISPKKSTTSSVGTLYLEKKVGNGWTPVTSWSIDGTGSVSITKTYTGTMGITYRTRVVVTTGVDKIDASSSISFFSAISCSFPIKKAGQTAGYTFQCKANLVLPKIITIQFSPLLGTQSTLSP